jgi:hypothetical protein
MGKEITLGQKILKIQKFVPTFTIDKAMDCTIIELNDLFDKVLAFELAKVDLELRVKARGY